MKYKNLFLLVLCNKYVSNILLMLLATCTVILCIEVFIFFVLDIKKPGYEPDRFFQSSLLTGHFHKPNAKGYWYRYSDGTKYQVSINRFGFADSERDLIKTGPRIALIGDSTTEFWEADEQYRGQYIIESLIGEQFEVLNFGVRGYGTDQTQILFKEIGVHFNPDIVIYTFCINDIHNNSTTVSKPYYIVDQHSPDALTLQGFPVEMQLPSSDNKDLSAKGVFDFLSTHSFIVRQSHGLLKAILGYKVPLDNHFELRHFLKTSKEDDIEKMAITLKIISMLKSEVEKKGMKFLLVEGVYKPVFPGVMQEKVIEQYGDVFDFNKVSNVLEEFSVKQQIEFLSLPKIIRERNIPVTDLMHKEDAMHLNKDGISFYANAVVNKLRSLGWVR